MSWALILAFVAGASAWKVKFAGAAGLRGNITCNIAQVGAVWQTSFQKRSGVAGVVVLGSFSQMPTSCTAEKLNDDLVYSYVVSGSDNGELRVRVADACSGNETPFKQTVCGVTSILAGFGVANSTNGQGKACGVPDGECSFVTHNGDNCEAYVCIGTPKSCSANLVIASFSFDVAITLNTQKCPTSGGVSIPFTDETSILAVGTPSGTAGGLSSCCAITGKLTNAPAPAPSGATATKDTSISVTSISTKSSASIVGIVSAAVGVSFVALL